jgi:hypothetical protein
MGYETQPEAMRAQKHEIKISCVYQKFHTL